ncbi:MAG: rhomboid family intramembrane serine protease [Planctomycetota bacterium]|nr:rhomboid family intramembrane serine protease [Planctomycetota bacterium]
MSKRDYMGHDFESRRMPEFWASAAGTKALIIAMIVIHVVVGIVASSSFSAGQWIREYLYLNPQVALKKLFLWQLVTAGFLHAAGIWHLFWNCLILWWFGKMVEGHLGTKRFVQFFVATIVAGSLAFILEAVVFDKKTPTLGASGAVNGVIVYAACLYPSREILVFFVLRMQLWVMAVLMVTADLIMLTQLPGGVAYSAHLGGAAFGFLFYRYGAKFGRVFDKIDEMAEERKRKQAAKVHQEEAEMRAELDRILDKVNNEGMTSLSEQERKFLKEASDRLRG